jgi:hypothetical protein
VVQILWRIVFIAQFIPVVVPAGGTALWECCQLQNLFAKVRNETGGGLWERQGN